jgi:uncharacterized membrane protein
MVATTRSRNNLIASLAVWLLILLYIGLFSWQSIARHQAFATNAYDMGNVNQAFWNTVHGRPLHFTNWRGVELDLANDSRLAMHVEPIYFLLAPIYWLWQQPETILLLQTIILALGALPVFWLARDRLGSHLAGVAFAAVYLLFPGLEAANMWEFHAVALAAPLLLFAFYFGQKKRWFLLWLFAILAMATKEEVSLSVLVMGFCFSVWGLIAAWRESPRPGGLRAWLRRAARTPQSIHGLALMLVAAVWFVVAVFVIVPHFEGSRSPYLSYYNQLSADAAASGNSTGGGSGGALGLLAAALRAVFNRRNVQYLIDLYTPVAFLSVFSPLAMAFSAPDLAINLLSTHEPMHFVEKYHYVAPLLPGVMISAIFGVAWLSRQIARLTKLPQRTTVLALTGVVLASTLYYHHYHGYTPLARAFESYQVTAHDRLGEFIAREIPADTTVSAQPNLNPHVSGRKTLYRFPYIGDAEYIFLDVSTLANKSDQYGLIHQLLTEGEFGLVRAEDGYLVLRRGAPQAPLPDAFFSFARVPTAPDGTLVRQPQYRTDIVFGDALRLVGFDLYDGRHTEMPQTPLRFFFYWQALKPLDQDDRFALYLLDDHRQVVGTIDLGELPGVQYWYPPTRWQPGETIRMEISDMPWWTGQFAKYGVALGVLGGNDPWERGARLLPQVGSSDLSIPLADDKTLAELMRFRTDPGGMPVRIESRVATELPSGAVRQEATWANGAELLGYRIADKSVRPGDELDVTLYWRTQQPLDKDYKVFVHVVREGQVVAQHDAEPDLGGYPTARWRAGEVVADWHPIEIPPEAQAGSASVVVGLYDPASGARAQLAQGGDSVTLSDTVTVNR